MTQSIQSASSLACIASVSPGPWPREHVDFLTRYCGLSQPMLFVRISTVLVPANDTDRHPSGPAERLQPETG